MEISNIPIAFCVILGNLIICYIIITVLHVFILLNKIKSNQIKLKDEDFHKYLLYHTKFYIILKRNKSSRIQTLCCKKKFFLSCSKTHFENWRSYRYYKQYCNSRAENWWHISTQKSPNVGSSIAISEPMIAGLVFATGSPNSMKLGNLVQ